MCTKHRWHLNQLKIINKKNYQFYTKIITKKCKNYSSSRIRISSTISNAVYTI